MHVRTVDDVAQLTSSTCAVRALVYPGPHTHLYLLTRFNVLSLVAHTARRSGDGNLGLGLGITFQHEGGGVA
jgi:hypothetical protein